MDFPTFVNDFPILRDGDEVCLNLPHDFEEDWREQLEKIYPKVRFSVIFTDRATPRVVFAYRPSPEPKPRPEGVVPLKDKLKFDKNG